MKNLSKYNKFIVAITGGVVAVLYNLYGADNEGVVLLVEILTALGVYQFANK